MSHILDTQFKSKQIFLSSQFSTLSNGNADCTWLLNEPLVAPNGIHMVFSLDNISLPFSWNSVNDNNNYFSYTDPASVDRTFTIANGNYTITSLVSVLNSSLVDITCSYNTVTNKLTFVSTVSDFTLKLDSTCFRLLGFTDAVAHASASMSLTSDQVVNLILSNGITINMHDITTDNIDGYTGKNSAYLARVPINQMPNSLIQYNATNHNVSIMNRYIKKLHISLQNDDRETITLQANTYWQLTITVHFVTEKSVNFDRTLLNYIKERYEKENGHTEKKGTKEKPKSDER
jgi:hypothetical protein